MAGRIVVVGYRPKPGKAEELAELVKSHWSQLFALRLVSDRLPIIMRAADGTVVEVFEWKSAQAITEAHASPEVQAMWAAFEPLCDYVAAKDVAELSEPFAEFEPL